MRTALLSTIEQTDKGETRAFLELGGRKLIDWQLDLVRDLGCERVICLAQGPSSELDNFRTRTERLGLEFHAIGGPLQLVGLVSADQELVVLGDGVVFDREFLKEAFTERRGVAVVPADAGIDARFERVDAQWAWGGLFIARAQIAEQLAEMPADSDTISLLLRMALQSGTRLVEIDAERLDDGSLLLATSGTIIENRENALLDRGVKQISWFGPGNALAQLAARKSAAKWISRGPQMSLATAIGAVLGAAALIQYSQLLWALVALFIAALVGSYSMALFSLKSKLLGVERPKYLYIIFNIIIDISLIISLTYPVDVGWQQRLFSAVTLLGGWRLAELLSSKKLESFWRDRSILIAILIFGLVLGLTSIIIQLLVLIALAFCLFLAGRSKITQA
jgi:molybdopterin-guanine dinucleotide biosynthesis protein A